jgi:hypothetical protein
MRLAAQIVCPDVSRGKQAADNQGRDLRHHGALVLGMAWGAVYRRRKGDVMAKKCWPWAHDWTDWKESKSRWASAFSLFAMPGSDLYETILVKVTKSRCCRKCGKYQNRKVDEYYLERG